MMPESTEGRFLAGERDQRAGEFDPVTPGGDQLAQVKVVGEQIPYRAESTDCLERRPLDRYRRAQRIVHRLDHLGKQNLRQEVGVDVQRLKARSERADWTGAISAGYDSSLLLGDQFSNDAAQVVSIDGHVGVAQHEDVRL